MTSERTIYLGLADQSSEPTRPVGILKLVRRGVIESGEFAYGTRYLQAEDAVALNPEYLPLQEGIFKLSERRLRDGGALPLTLRDALPDNWGRAVLEARQGGPVDDIDALLMTNRHRIGAMVFNETLPLPSPLATEATHDADAHDDAIPLTALHEAVMRIERHLEITSEMRRLLQRGGTLGGARPKMNFIHDNRRWIAKFPSASDDHDVEVLEAATLELAAQCGIEVPARQLVAIPNGHALLVQRFDRLGPLGQERCLHYLSAAALLDAPYESSLGSYVELAQLIRRISAQPRHDLVQLFRRLVLNLIVDNTDDHVKNHGMLYAGNGQYRLSPAFDMVMQLNNLGYQQLAITPGVMQSSLSLARDAAVQFGLDKTSTEGIITHTRQQAENSLATIVRSLGGNEVLIARVRTCLERQWRIINA
ncbi:type II toxin-antitoxin system HipA family toxin [Pseudomethylobacillus aquaticus]|uniref:Type II toxin-antitoxin system HipA family toxin n=1 Tax=Pseudomethylobacillus aquaticus TaxID=2676064 RepID=A0A3N0V0Y2_9PROT|nr:type II toxin-antitoxin system HipA family toxin [Pseudomethylobacillus aquaticus]